MRKTRIAIAVCVLVASTLGISSLMAKGRPAPPPPVLCGCLCPDGSFVITHAPNENACPTACATACAAGGETY
jgi:hypothetical protein